MWRRLQPHVAEAATAAMEAAAICKGGTRSSAWTLNVGETGDFGQAARPRPYSPRTAPLQPPYSRPTAALQPPVQPPYSPRTAPVQPPYSPPVRRSGSSECAAKPRALRAGAVRCGTWTKGVDSLGPRCRADTWCDAFIISGSNECAAWDT